MKELKALKNLGYELFLKDNSIHYMYKGKGQPDRILTGHLLTVIKKHKRLVKKLLIGIINSPNQHPKMVAVYFEEIKQKEKGITNYFVAWTNGIVTKTATDLQDIADILADENILKIFFDAATSVYSLEGNGYLIKNYTDILLMDQLLTNDSSSINDVEKLVKKYSPVNSINNLGISVCFSDEMRDWNFEIIAKRSEAILALYLILAEKIEESYLEEVLDREINALPALVKLKKDGFFFDYNGWEIQLKKMQEECNELEKQIVADLNAPELNIYSSSELLATLLKNGINVVNTAEECLSSCEDAYPVIKKIGIVKKMSKKIKTFGERLKELIDKDGRIRANWKLNGTNTGRMACNSPNLQGMPAKAKPYFHAGKGHKLVIADYSQIELRVLASLSKDKCLVESFMNNDDLHKKAVALILSKPLEEVSDAERQIAKTANFGLIYGMTAASLSRKVKAKYGVNMSIEEASMFRNQYFRAYSGVLAFQDKMLQEAEIVTAGGRRWSNLEPGSIKRYNYPVQGTAAEGLKEALAVLLSRIKEDWLLVNVIHDEIVLEVPEEAANSAAKVLEESMIEGMVRLIPNVPILVDVKISDFWC